MGESPSMINYYTKLSPTKINTVELALKGRNIIEMGVSPSQINYYTKLYLNLF